MADAVGSAVAGAIGVPAGVGDDNGTCAIAWETERGDAPSATAATTPKKNTPPVRQSNLRIDPSAFAAVPPGPCNEDFSPGGVSAES